MTRRAAFLSEFCTYAEGEENAHTAAEAFARSELAKQNKLTINDVATVLSHSSLKTNWKRWVKRVTRPDGTLAFYWMKGAEPPKLTKSGRIPKVISRRRRHEPAPAPKLEPEIASRLLLAEGKTAGPASTPYKLELSGDDLLVSTRLTRDQCARLLLALLEAKP